VQPNRPPPDRTRQSAILLAVAVLLIVGGLAVLLFLERLPAPVRFGVGSFDLIAGLALLVARRQGRSHGN